MGATAAEDSRACFFKGDLDEQDVARLPRDWGAALDAFEASDWARDAFGEEFCRTYSLIKRYEYEKFRRTVSSSKRELYIEFL